MEEALKWIGAFFVFPIVLYSDWLVLFPPLSITQLLVGLGFTSALTVFSVAIFYYVATLWVMGFIGRVLSKYWK